MSGTINLSRRNFLKTGSLIGGGIFLGLSPVQLAGAKGKEAAKKAPYSLDALEIYGKGVLNSEGVVVDKEGNVYGGGLI